MPILIENLYAPAMNENLPANFAWQQWREHLERTYGNGVFVSKSWIAQRLPKPKTKVVRSNMGETLEIIQKDLGDCTRCKLCKARKNLVFGEGNPQAQLMFVGEGPGEQEDIQGRPFVGKAGQLLDRIIEAMGFKREQVYIANVVKCRPPSNRVPEPDEVAMCEPFLQRQIACIKPKIIVALGGTALKCLIDPDARITKMRGQLIEYQGVKLMPTYHPAFLLRNPEAKKDVWEDMKKVTAMLRSP